MERKTTQRDVLGDKKTLMRENVNDAKKGNLKRKTESLLIAAQSNAIRTNCIKSRIDKTQQNSKSRLCGDIETKRSNEAN